jgi:hypothetical protein
VTRLTPVLVVALLALGHVAEARQAVAPGEVLAEIRVHGNYATPDAEVLRLAGLTIGQPIDDAAVDAATRRLKESGQFDDVEIRKRYRSLEPGGDVALVIVVREHPLPDKTAPGPAPLRPLRRLFASGMVMPILSYTDGYGLTYGGRVSFVDALGRGSRISVPASWGGTRRVAVEFDRPVSSGPFDRITGGVGVSGRTNPFYELDEDRRDAWVDASRQLSTYVRAVAHVGFGHVHFGEIAENVVSYGADLTFDTRRDPVFPRNAVFASAGWQRLQPSQSASVNRFRADARAYRGFVGQSVLSLRVQYDGADGTQPAYARNLLGGAGSLRGYRAGSFAGDNRLAASAELRIPISSPMGITRAGVSLFTDTGTVWDAGERLSDSRFRIGGGAGVFLLASLFQMSLDVGVARAGEPGFTSRPGCNSKPAFRHQPALSHRWHLPTRDHGEPRAQPVALGAVRLAARLAGLVVELHGLAIETRRGHHIACHGLSGEVDVARGHAALDVFDVAGLRVERQRLWHILGHAVALFVGDGQLVTAGAPAATARLLVERQRPRLVFAHGGDQAQVQASGRTAAVARVAEQLFGPRQTALGVVHPLDDLTESVADVRHAPVARTLVSPRRPAEVARHAPARGIHVAHLRADGDVARHAPGIEP